MGYKKGFLQIDFAFAALIFSLLIFTTYIYVDEYKVSFNNDLESEKLYSDAKDICNILISNSGVPNNWENNLSSLVTLGLKNNSGPNLDINKVNTLILDNYFNITDKLYLKEHYVKIQIRDLKNNQLILDFGEISQIKLSQKYTCYSRFNDSEVKVIVEVWK